VKTEYKKNGSRLPEHQMRQLQRGFELDQRAARQRELDEKKRAAKKKREEKERKEREARRQIGVGLATQLAGYSHTQRRLKSGMEAFVKMGKRGEGNGDKMRAMECEEEKEFREKLEKIAQVVDREPWDDEDNDVGEVEGLDVKVGKMPELIQVVDGGAGGVESLIDDDLDDETLLEAHDLVMSDAGEDVLELVPARLPSPPLVAKRLLQHPMHRTGDAEFVRLHGPVNKALEGLLEQLPGPLIELLSIDSSMNERTWKPPPSLLHKLSPIGLPSHRLRIKVGCLVTLLQDANTKKPLKSLPKHPLPREQPHGSLLRVMRVEKDMLECLVLDGRLEGTIMNLARVPFEARYRNDAQTSFRRVQFPIRIATGYIPPSTSQSTPQSSLLQSSFSTPCPPAQATKQSDGFKKPASSLPKPKPVTAPTPVFKIPGMPASKLADPPAPRKNEEPVLSMLLDGWDDFLDSGTQIARELSMDNPKAQRTPTTISSIFDDCDITLEDLEEIDLSQHMAPKVQEQISKKPATKMKHPPKSLSPVMNLRPQHVAPKGNKQDNRPVLQTKPPPKEPDPVARHIARKPPEPYKQNNRIAVINAKPPASKPLHPTIPTPLNQRPHTTPALRPLTPRPNPPASNLKRKAPFHEQQGPVKKQHVQQSVRPIAKPKSSVVNNVSTKSFDNVPTKSFGSFSEFGLSTQDAVYFFDDDEFSSSGITV
jgi:hypothetical protein